MIQTIWGKISLWWAKNQSKFIKPKENTKPSQKLLQFLWEVIIKLLGKKGGVRLPLKAREVAYSKHITDTPYTKKSGLYTLKLRINHDLAPMSHINVNVLIPNSMSNKKHIPSLLKRRSFHI